METTKSGTSSRSAREILEDKIDRTMKAIRIAQANPLRTADSYVEADPDVLNFMAPHGLGEAGYLVYEGIKVFPTGRGEEILKYEAESPVDRERRLVMEREAKERAEKEQAEARA